MVADNKNIKIPKKKVKSRNILTIEEQKKALDRIKELKNLLEHSQKDAGELSLSNARIKKEKEFYKRAYKSALIFLKTGEV